MMLNTSDMSVAYLQRRLRDSDPDDEFVSVDIEELYHLDSDDAFDSNPAYFG
jgi:hypothetical protein